MAYGHIVTFALLSILTVKVTPSDMLDRAWIEPRNDILYIVSDWTSEFELKTEGTNTKVLSTLTYNTAKHTITMYLDRKVDLHVIRSCLDPDEYLKSFTGVRITGGNDIELAGTEHIRAELVFQKRVLTTDFSATLDLYRQHADEMKSLASDSFRDKSWSWTRILFGNLHPSTLLRINFKYYEPLETKNSPLHKSVLAGKLVSLDERRAALRELNHSLEVPAGVTVTFVDPSGQAGSDTETSDQAADPIELTADSPEILIPLIARALASESSQAESNDSDNIIRLRVNRQSFDKIVDIIVSETMDLNQLELDDVLELYNTAVYLGLTDIARAIETWLAMNLSIGNVAKLHQFAVKKGLRDVLLPMAARFAFKVGREHFANDKVWDELITVRVVEPPSRSIATQQLSSDDSDNDSSDTDTVSDFETAASTEAVSIINTNNENAMSTVYLTASSELSRVSSDDTVDDGNAGDEQPSLEAIKAAEIQRVWTDIVAYNAERNEKFGIN